MSDTTNDSARPTDPVGRAIFRAARLLALAGGVVMVAISIMVVTSVLGRWLFLAPIPGDFEMVAIGTAISVFLFLPYCHLVRGNVLVDLFLARAPRGLQVFFDIVSGLLLAAIAGMMSWRMIFGGADMRQYGETTLILGIPVWPVFPVGVISFGLLALCCLYTAIRDAASLRR